MKLHFGRTKPPEKVILLVETRYTQVTKILSYEQCRLWLQQNPGHRNTRLSIETLVDKAGRKVSSAENAIAGFEVMEVSPFIPTAIPYYAFTKKPSEFASTIMVASIAAVQFKST